MNTKTQSITGIPVKDINWNSSAQKWQGYYWNESRQAWLTNWWSIDGYNDDHVLALDEECLLTPIS